MLFVFKDFLDLYSFRTSYVFRPTRLLKPFVVLALLTLCNCDVATVVLHLLSQLLYATVVLPLPLQPLFCSCSCSSVMLAATFVSQFVLQVVTTVVL